MAGEIDEGADVAGDRRERAKHPTTGALYGGVGPDAAGETGRAQIIKAGSAVSDVSAGEVPTPVDLGPKAIPSFTATVITETPIRNRRFLQGATTARDDAYERAEGPREP